MQEELVTEFSKELVENLAYNLTKLTHSQLKPFDCKELLYFDYQALPKDAADAVGVRRVDDLKDFLSQCDIVTVNAPLHEGTHHLMLVGRITAKTDLTLQ